VVQVIDQRLLPHTLKILDLHSVEDAIDAIYTLTVRGGGTLIGASAACTAHGGRVLRKNQGCPSNGGEPDLRIFSRKRCGIFLRIKHGFLKCVKLLPPSPMTKPNAAGS
jgi:hypothetical protein